MEKETIFYFGHPKAGSTWLGGLMAGLSIDMGLDFFYGQYVLPKNQKILKEKRFDIIISQNSNYQVLQDLQIPYKGFHVIRDPRDICVSSYFSYKKTHPLGTWRQLKTIRESLNNKSIEEGLIEIFDLNRNFFNSMIGWNYNDKNILEVKYEDLINDPENELIAICDFLFPMQDGISFSFKVKAILNRVLFRNKFLYNHLRINNNKLNEGHVKYLNQKLSFKNLSKGRKKGTENTNSHYRKGVSGDWKNYVKGEIKEEFKIRYGDLLIKLGYEDNLLW